MIKNLKQYEPKIDVNQYSNNITFSINKPQIQKQQIQQVQKQHDLILQEKLKKNKIKKYVIYGERCSGTNYLEELITKNFYVNHTDEYGHKHFFGFNDISNSDDTLFIYIVRNPFSWLNSLLLTQHHLKKTNNIYHFLNNYNIEEFNWNGQNIKDKNIYTNDNYKNLFELRHTKLKFLIEDLPKKVKNYIFIKHEDLLYNFKNTMNLLKDCGLIVKTEMFPLNSDILGKDKSKKFKNNTKDIISKEIILNNPYFEKLNEKKLGYI